MVVGTTARVRFGVLHNLFCPLTEHSQPVDRTSALALYAPFHRGDRGCPLVGLPCGTQFDRVVVVRISHSRRRRYDRYEDALWSFLNDRATGTDEAWRESVIVGTVGTSIGGKTISSRRRGGRRFSGMLKA